MVDERSQLLAIFLNEVDDLLGSAEAALLRLEAAPAAGRELEELFRAVHTLKSSSAMVGMGPISSHLHGLESLLDRLRSHQLALTRPLASFLLKDLDLLGAMVRGGARGAPGAIDPELLAARAAQLHQLVKEAGSPPAAPAVLLPTASPSVATTRLRLGLTFPGELPAAGPDPLVLVAGLSDLGEVEDLAADLSRLPPFDQLAPGRLYLAWHLTLQTAATADEVRAYLAAASQDCDLLVEEAAGDGTTLPPAAGDRGEGGAAAQPAGTSGERLPGDRGVTPTDSLAAGPESRPQAERASIRVGVEKLDCLVDLADEMRVAVSRLQGLFENGTRPHPDAVSRELAALAKLNRELQERVAQVRMAPLADLFRRFQRLARDTAAASAKQVRVLVAGAEVELDREVIERVADPLKHLVRNCIDHGIEPPEARLAAGKPAAGTLSLAASRRGGRILVEISDDGRGFDLIRIRQRAREMGLIRQDQALDQDTLLDLVCSPGFSSAAQVTELSGRGVGMDVVRTEVGRLGGRLAMDTRPGAGTTFLLELPLTFTLLEALHVRSGNVSYLVPLLGIRATEPYRRNRTETVGPGQRLYRLRDEYLPLLDLGQLAAEGAAPDEERRMAVILLDTGQRRFGLLVDEVLDPQQVVVKSLETNFRGVKGLAGASLLGDGAVALVLDLGVLEEALLAGEKGPLLRLAE
ncbi:MAG: chemotaxis protein CheA [Thermodesulfobacteriota bacterium]